MDHIHHSQDAERHNRRGKWVLIGFLAIAAFFLWTEHRAHLLGFLPYLLILACPLMHLFHHGGHGHHGNRPSSDDGSANRAENRPGEQP